MNRLKIVKGILLHICVICSIAEIIIQILDWYNPFMDFAGHSSWVLYLLCTGVLLLAALSNLPRKKNLKKV